MISKVIFYLLWPLLWFYMPLTRRARVLVFEGNKILAVKGRIGPNLWQLPGGGIKYGESAIDAARRELKEELNLDIASLIELNDSFIVCKQFGLLFRLHFFTASIKKDANIIIQKSEIREYRWLDIDNLQNISTEVKIAVDLVLRQR